METYTYTVGSAYRRDIMIRLDELNLPYVEHRTMFESVIVVTTYTEAHEDSYYEFELDFADFQNRLNEIKRRRAERQQEALLREQAKKLARKNRWRRLTFRRPLQWL